jgi:multidrug resistance efflux pump
MLAAANAKLSAKEQLVAKYEANKLQAKLNYERQRALAEDRIKPEVEIEKLKRELDGAEAELAAALQDVEAARNEALAKKNELEEKRNVAQTKIDYARAMQQDALGKAATIRKEISDVEMELQGFQRRTVYAPRDGTIFRMPIYELGQTLKEGEAVVTIVPDVTQKAVELHVPGNDMPLIEEGQEVRLQFEGWPAVQFAGWPSVAVGTFGGLVANVDATDNGKGQFRILITPNSESEPWPSDRFLRQGVRANGWVMLRRVTIGYEIWRQLNGFPVMVADTEPKDATKVKPPKVD